MLKSNNPALESWIDVPENSDFPIQNLPFGIFSTDDSSKRVGVAIGNQILDLAKLAAENMLPVREASVFSQDVLNPMMKLGKSGTREIRERVSELLSKDNTELQSLSNRDAFFVSMQDAQMHMPVEVGDYTDFYSSKEHATNVGTMFRDPNNALLPNWLYIPVGYHGRASSIVVSGTPIHRPKGQQRPKDDEPPVFGPSKLLDFELEMAFVTYEGKPMGQSISTAEAEDFIFGMCLFNDWSARDIQKWEYVPLGPFLAKNFASSISPWIVTMDALDPYRTNTPDQEPEVFDYLKFNGQKSFDIALEMLIEPSGGSENRVCLTNYKYMYWNMSQQLAHHSINGCNIRCGDMMASGTISGPTPDSYGSMLEISWRGSKPVTLNDGSERKFILDGDTVIQRGWCDNGTVRIGFGEVRTEVLPAI
jgi:fumarylacetoacetase